MPTFTYTAKRQIKSGHSADTQYTITTDLHQVDGGMPVASKTEHRTLGGNQVTVLSYVDEFISVTTDWINADGTGSPDVDDYREFLFSVAGGEEFTFNNGEDQQVVMDGMPTRMRNGILYNYRFRMRVVA